jgi:tetraacyldisaccharide 4'-kinase
MRSLAGQRVLAFAGIGRPDKFFATLAEAGLTLAGQQAFPDHHAYRPAEVAKLQARAASLGAQLVATTKDHVRLTQRDQAGVLALGAELVWDDDPAIDAILSCIT